jgi:hypothetical protein
MNFDIGSVFKQRIGESIPAPTDGVLRLSLGNRLSDEPGSNPATANTKWDIRLVVLHDDDMFTNLGIVQKSVEPEQLLEPLLLKVPQKRIVECFVGWVERYGLTKVHRCARSQMAPIGTGLDWPVVILRWSASFATEDHLIFEEARCALAYPK